MDLTDLHALSATDAARLIREGVITSVQLVEACLARVEAVDGEVEAWAFLDPDHALAQARAADDRRLAGQPPAISSWRPRRDRPTRSRSHAPSRS